MLGEATMRSALLASGLLLDILPLLEGSAAKNANASMHSLQARVDMAGTCLTKCLTASRVSLG